MGVDRRQYHPSSYGDRAEASHAAEGSVAVDLTRRERASKAVGGTAQ